MPPRFRLVFLAFVLALGTACSIGSGAGNDAETAAVEATMEAARDALAAGDVSGLMEHWTDRGLEQVFDESGEAFRGNTGYYLAAKQYRLGAESAAPVIQGDSATVVAPLFFRLVGPARKFSLIKKAGSWVIDGAQLTTTAVHGVTTVSVAFGEAAINFDASAPADGGIALEIRNPTSQTHQLNILTAPPDQDLTAFFEHPEDAPPVPEGRSMPEGFDFVGGVVGIEPGMSVTVVMYQVLPPSRYVLFCNQEDDGGGRPHSMNGEYLEFTVD